VLHEHSGSAHSPLALSATRVTHELRATAQLPVTALALVASSKLKLEYVLGKDAQPFNVRGRGRGTASGATQTWTDAVRQMNALKPGASPAYLVVERSTNKPAVKRVAVCLPDVEALPATSSEFSSVAAWDDAAQTNLNFGCVACPRLTMR
jgi:hypothetical protein